MDNLALLQDVLVKVEFLIPDHEKAASTHSLNPIFSLRTALGQICSRNILDSKKARLWKVSQGKDELLDLDKVSFTPSKTLWLLPEPYFSLQTPAEAHIQSGEILLVEIQRNDGQWVKISPTDAKGLTNEDVMRSVLNKFVQNQGSGPKRNYGEPSHNDRNPYQFDHGAPNPNRGGNLITSSYRTMGPSSAMDVDDDLQRALQLSKAQAVVDVLSLPFEVLASVRLTSFA